MYLVVIDAHSKWLEVFQVKNATTIQKLRTLFAQFGLPKTVVSDNGSCFTSREFHLFMSRNGIHHIRTSPYHPSSNGLAERAVRVFKESFKKMKEGTVTDRLARAYRNTPHSTTGVPPAELMFGRKLRGQFDILKPSVETTVEYHQERQKLNHDQHSRMRSFSEREAVFFRNFGPGETWLAGTITRVSGPLSYHIQLADGRVVRRHQDHIRKCTRTSSSTTDSGNCVTSSNGSSTHGGVSRVRITWRSRRRPQHFAGVPTTKPGKRH